MDRGDGRGGVVAQRVVLRVDWLLFPPAGVLAGVAVVVGVVTTLAVLLLLLRVVLVLRDGDGGSGSANIVVVIEVFFLRSRNFCRTLYSITLRSRRSSKPCSLE